MLEVADIGQDIMLFENVSQVQYLHNYTNGNVSDKAIVQLKFIHTEINNVLCFILFIVLWSSSRRYSLNE